MLNTTMIKTTNAWILYLVAFMRILKYFITINFKGNCFKVGMNHQKGIFVEQNKTKQIQTERERGRNAKINW